MARATKEKGRTVKKSDTRMLLSLEETALILGIGRSTMYRAVRSGSVPFPVHRIGGFWYVPRAALQRFLNGEQLGQMDVGGSANAIHSRSG
jgi:excisionase family DNA binding protein